MTTDVLGMKVKEPMKLAERLRMRNVITAYEFEEVSKYNKSHKIEQAAILSYILYYKMFKDGEAEAKIIREALNEGNSLLHHGKNDNCVLL